MKIILDAEQIKGLRELKAQPRQTVIRFTSKEEREAYATVRHAEALTMGERHEALAIYLLDVAAYYPTQEGKAFGDLELTDSTKVQVKGNGGELGKSRGTQADQLARAYKAIEQDASSLYLLIADREKGFALVSKEQLKASLPDLLKDSESLRLTLNEKRLRQCFPYDYQRI